MIVTRKALKQPTEKAVHSKPTVSTKQPTTRGPAKELQYDGRINYIHAWQSQAPKCYDESSMV